MNTLIKVSAPGKLMLLGEHAVVYHRPCLVTAVGQRMQASVEFTSDKVFSLAAPDVQVTRYTKQISDVGRGGIPKGAKFVEYAIKNFVEKYPVNCGIKVTTQSEFSAQFGFGSSAAATVCVLAGLFVLTRYNKGDFPDLPASLPAGMAGRLPISDRIRSDDERKELFDLAYKTVLDIQGRASGFDVAAVIYGGSLYFVGGGRVIEPLMIPPIPLIIGYTGVKADSVTLVRQVAEKKAANPHKMEKLFAAITQLVEQAKAALLQSDYQRLGKLMDFNQEYLRDLGVSSEILENLISAAKKAGAYGAKLSGAGGGDCMITLAPPDKTAAVKRAIIQAGGQVIDVQTGAQGVRVES